MMCVGGYRVFGLVYGEFAMDVGTPESFRKLAGKALSLFIPFEG
jgi:hypothetical protein